MKRSFLLLSLFAASFVSGQKKDYPIQAVNFTEVKFTDNFWLPRIKINHTVTIPTSFERCESTGRIKNFEMAAAKQGKFCTIFPFDDTDIYKTIEGASYSLSLFPDKKLEVYIDSLITKVGMAQEPDGYLYTARTIDPLHPHQWAGKERWERERELSHELYNAGHLYEAAAAHFYATGKRTLLNIALKNADLVCSIFGPGKKHVAPGHEIVEMGLVKLYRITGKQEYLASAKDFIDQRGHYDGYNAKDPNPFKNGAYWQDAKPLIEQREAVGHAVRAAYLYSGVADIAALTGDKKYLEAVDSIWENVVTKKLYVQGGLGAIPEGERFGNNYELPNSTAYNETCAAIANVFWNQRMFQLNGHAKYIDLLEKSLYNGVISGLGLDGKTFFYTNAMQVRNSFTHSALERSRAGWFDCSCCPTNLMRLIPSIPGYVYAQKGNDVYVNLFVASNATVNVAGKTVGILQENNYPWNGNLKFTLSPKSATNFNLLVRIPGWAQNEVVASDLYKFTETSVNKPEIKINGKVLDYTLQNGYAVLAKSWKKGDVVEVNLPMDVNKIVANEKVKDDIGKVALQRGPLVYCAEWVDNNGKAGNILMPSNVTYTASFQPGLLNGVTTLKTEVPVIDISQDGQHIQTTNKAVTVIPYYAWANRGEGEMVMWFPQSIKDVDIITSDAKTAIIQK